MLSFQFKTNLRAMLYHPSGVLFLRKTICFDKLLLSLLRNFIAPVVVLALDFSRSCNLACYFDHILVKHSTTALLIS